jgi:hypothetical protein
VQQLRSTKLMWAGKSCKVYELVFGKVVSEAVAVCAGDTWQVLLLPNMLLLFPARLSCCSCRALCSTVFPQQHHVPHDNIVT